MNRAVLIVTDAEAVYWDGGPFEADKCGQCPTDPQLLTDLRTLVGQRTDTWEEFQHAAARVRDLLPKEES